MLSGYYDEIKDNIFSPPFEGGVAVVPYNQCVAKADHGRGG